MILLQFYTYEKALLERNNLNNYINLIEGYNPDTFEKWVVYQYAFQGSIIGVVRQLNHSKYIFDSSISNKVLVKTIITGPTIDSLHSHVKKHYNKKIRHHNRKVRV